MHFNFALMLRLKIQKNLRKIFAASGQLVVTKNLANSFSIFLSKHSVREFSFSTFFCGKRKWK
jgi:hypothetical protein